MISRVAVVSIVSAALSLPAFAQSNSTTPSDQTGASQSVSDNSREPIAAPRSNDFWDGDEPNVVNLVMHPFASKGYVKRLTGPIRDRVNELDELTSANQKMIRDVDGRAQQGIQLASEKVGLADQHASDAATKAQAAQLSANTANSQVANVETMVGNLDQYKPGTQTEIRFRPGQSVLSKQAKDALDEMASPLKDQRSYIIEVRGFAAGHGQTAIANSQKMADSVVRYLVLNHNIPVYRIYVLSMGNAPVEGMSGKRASGGRVEVNLLKNNLTASAQQ